MPSKVKSKKSHKKSKHSVSTACWAQNDDGTLSLTIGSKKSNSVSESNDNSSSSDRSIESQVTLDFNSNTIADITQKSPHAFAAPSIAFKILKPNWSENAIDYRQQQQTKRRNEMIAQ